MSEPNSLYMRVMLTEASYRAFLKAPLTPPRQYDDWLTWLATRQFYGSITADEIDAMAAPTAAGLLAVAKMFNAPQTAELTDPVTVEDYVTTTVQSPYCAPSKSRYDSVANTWTLIVGQYSENYYDYIEVLSILRAVAGYKDLPGDSFILIYPYVWGGGEPDVTVTIEQGSSTLGAAPEQAVEEADRALESLIDELGLGKEDDDNL